MWIWILLGILALLIITALSIPLVITLRFDGTADSLYADVRYGFYQKQLFPKPTANPTSAKKKKDDTSSVGALVKTHGPIETVSLMIQSTVALWNGLKTLLKGAKIRHFKGVFAIGGTDAADAATNYGQVCATLYPFLGLVASHMTFVHPDLQLYCDYESPSSTIGVFAEIHVSVLRFPFAAGYAFRYLLYKNLEKGGRSHERSKKRKQST